ncbi:MAG: metal ABC transporter substrate-binding protein [Candidatus Ratteibacteria bacterium]
MRKKILYGLFFLFIWSYVLYAAPIKIVATTSQLGSLVQEIGGNLVSPVVMIPAGSCPGHHELRPGDIRALLSGAGFIYHGWEGFAENVIERAKIASLSICKIDLSGSWLLPATQSRAAEMVYQFLSRIDNSHSAQYRNNYETFLKKMASLEKTISFSSTRLRLRGLPVIVSDQQDDFLLALGVDVVASFGREESLTLSDMNQMILVGRKKKVKMVVENLQSASGVGKRIAEQLQVPYVVISNFPGAWPGTSNIESTVKENIRRLGVRKR